MTALIPGASVGAGVDVGVGAAVGETSGVDVCCAVLGDGAGEAVSVTSLELSPHPVKSDSAIISDKIINKNFFALMILYTTPFA
jgi:hypothetical protein